MSPTTDFGLTAQGTARHGESKGTVCTSHTEVQRDGALSSALLNGAHLLSPHAVSSLACYSMSHGVLVGVQSTRLPSPNQRPAACMTRDSVFSKGGVQGLSASLRTADSDSWLCYKKVQTRVKSSEQMLS